MKNFVRLYLILALAFLHFSCSHASNVNQSPCQIDGTYTSLTFGHYVVHLFGPNDPDQADIWEGPICVVNSLNLKECNLDASLIKSVGEGLDPQTMTLITFSGSNSYTHQVSLDDCRILEPRTQIRIQ